MTPVRSLLVAVPSLALVVSGCTGTGSASSPGGSPSDSASPSASPSARTATPSPPVVPAPPRAAACYRLVVDQLTEPTNDSDPVPCRTRHTARTIFVGRLDTVVDGHAVAVDSDTVQRQLSTTCTRRLAAYVGGSRATRDLARFHVIWYSPSLTQSDAGADWFRCDLIAFSGQSSLYPQPRKGRLKGVLDRPGALDTFGLCGTAAPGTSGFRRVICARPHSWRALTTIALTGGKAYPGQAKVRKAGDGACKARARSRSSGALKFTYGWEWPTRDQWTGGQHFGYCWVPS